MLVRAWPYLRVVVLLLLLVGAGLLLLSWLGVDPPLCPNDPTYGPCGP